jgi:carboxymethylenebutenolidase
MTEIAVPNRDGDRAGYLATPDRAAPWPGVVVIHEIFGINDDIRRLSDRVAAMGYLALAPDFYRGGAWARCMRPALRQLEAGRGEFLDAIDSARGWLAARDDCTGLIGVIGFSIGGGFALLAASRYDFAVASANYGEVPEDAERVLAGACPVIASYGGREMHAGPRHDAAEHAWRRIDSFFDTQLRRPQ